jgi:hypothetical protein
MRFKKVRFFPRSVISSNGGVWTIENANNLRMWTFHPYFFSKSSFSEPRWTTHRQFLQASLWNAHLSTATQKQALLCCMRPWTLRKASQKVTNWSGIKNEKPSDEIKLSWYQSIDKKHFWVYVKFEVEKWVPKKWEPFSGFRFGFENFFFHKWSWCWMVMSLLHEISSNLKICSWRPYVHAHTIRCEIQQSRNLRPMAVISTGHHPSLYAWVKPWANHHHRLEISNLNSNGKGMLVQPSWAHRSSLRTFHSVAHDPAQWGNPLK